MVVDTQHADHRDMPSLAVGGRPQLDDAKFPGIESNISRTAHPIIDLINLDTRKSVSALKPPPYQFDCSE